MKMNASIKYSDQFYVYLWYAIVKTRKSVFGLKSDFEPPLAHSAVMATRLADRLYSKQEGWGGIGIYLPGVYMYFLASIIYRKEA